MRNILDLLRATTSARARPPRHGASRRARGLAFALAAALSTGSTACGGGASRPASGGRPASRPAATRPAPADAGAGSSRAAVAEFLAAARTTDVRAMGLLFGTAAGPVVARDAAADVEKRMRALACYLAHDEARVVDDLPAVGAGAGRALTVALRQRELARETRFTAVQGPAGRWYVASFDVERLSDFCRPR